MRQTRLIFLLLVVVFFLTACGNQQVSNTNKSKKPSEELKEEQKVTATTRSQAEEKEIATVTATTRSQADQKEIDAFWNDAEEWGDYLSEWDNNPLYSELFDLENKRMEAARNQDETKAFSYLHVELDKCKELIESLHKKYVPEIAKSSHDYNINAYIKHKQWLEYFINTWDSGNYDLTKSLQMQDERDLLFSKWDQEGQRVKRDLERRAESLGID